MYEALLELYSTLQQDIPALGPVTFELADPSGDEFSTDMNPETGEVKIKKAGVYLVGWDFGGILHPSHLSPDYIAALGISVNGAVEFGSVSGSPPTSRPNICVYTSGYAVLDLKVGDSINLVSFCADSAQGEDSSKELIGPIASARLNVTFLRSSD